MKQRLFLICAVLMTAIFSVSAQTNLDLSSGNLTISAPGTYNVTQSGGVTTNTLTINSTTAGVVQVTITGLNVSHTTSSPIMINSTNTTPVVITVNGENTLETSATDGHASINNASQANLTINGTGTVRSTILNSLLIRKYDMKTATSLYLTDSVKLISAGRVVSDNYSDAASGGTIEIDGAILENSGTYSIEMMKAANFVMKNGSIKNTGTSESSNAIQVQGTTGISISGGTITSEKHVVYIAAGAVVSITGGILTSNGMNCSAVYHNGTGMLTISNGTFKATATGAPTIRKQSTGGITINGGSFEAAVSNVIMGKGSETGITINGGDFKATGLSAAVALTGTGYNLTMKGGTVRHTNEAGSAQAVRLTSTDCNFVMTGGTLSIPQSSAATVIRVDKKARATINNYFIECVDNDLKMYGIDGDSTGTVKQISGTNKSTINYVKGLENNIHCTFIGTPNKITAGTPTYWFKPEDTSNYTGLQLRTSNRYNITYGNLEGSTANNPTEYYEGAGIASFNNPTSQPTCKTFVGWFTAPTGGTQVTSIPVTATGNYNLYAQWNNKPPFNAGEINTNGETVCHGAIPNTIISEKTPISGGGGTITYQWQKSTDNSTWSTITGTNSATYKPTDALTQDTWYRRQAHSECEGDVFSTSVGTWKITVIPTAEGGTVSSAQTICYNTQPSALTLSGHVGTVVQWEWSPNGTDNWNAIANTTTTLTGAVMGNLTADCWYRAKVESSNNCSEDYSNAVKITVLAQANAGTISSAQTICYNTQPNNLTVSGHTGTVVRWEWSANGIDNWNAIANTTTTLTSANMGNLTADRWYRVVVKNGASCSEVTSGAVKIDIIDLNTITLTSAVGTDNQAVCKGDDITTITYATTGATGATITNLPNGVTGVWNANVITIQGTPTVTDTYTITLTGGCGNITAIGKITVNDLPAEPTATTTIVTNCTGTPNGTLTVTSPLGAGYTYSVDGGAFQSEVLFTDLASGNHTLTVKNVSSCTKSTTINIGATPDIPTINITGETTVCKGFTTALTASGAATYNWYKGNTASGEIVCSTAEFTTPPLDVNTTYTVKGTGGNSCTSTQSVTVTVNDKPTISAITQPSQLCAGDALTLTTPTVTNNGSNITSQGWFLNGVAFTSGTVVSYADNGKTLVYKATNNCGETTSNEVTINVSTPPTKPESITGNADVCLGETTTLTATGGGEGSSCSYQWGTGDVGTNIIEGATSESYTTLPLTQNTTYWVRRVGTSACNDITEAATINVTLTKYTITATSGENGTITPSGVTEYDCNATSTYTITPNEGYEITDVLVDGISVGAVDSYTFSSLNSNHTISVTFNLQKLRVITVAQPAVGGSTTGDGLYDYNTLVTVTATPNDGYEFVNWTGDITSTEASFSFNIKQDVILTANFKLIEYNITYETGVTTISNQNDLPTTYTVESHLNIPDAIAVRDFYTFNGWHLDAPDGQVVNNTDDLGSGDHTLYANLTRAIPGTEIVISLGRLLAVRNANDYAILRTALYTWSRGNTTLPSKRHYVEVGEPIPGGDYKVIITIDEEMPIVLERSFAQQAGAYPNPVAQYDVINIISENDAMEKCDLTDASGRVVKTRAVRTATGYQVEIPVGAGFYTLKLMDVQGNVSIHKIIVK